MSDAAQGILAQGRLRSYHPGVMGRAYWNRGEDACGTVIGEFMSTYLYECYMRGRESLNAEVVRKLI